MIAAVGFLVLLGNAAVLQSPAAPTPPAPGMPSHRWAPRAEDANLPDGPPQDERPTLAALRAAATELTLAEPARARSLVERARWAGLLPQIQVGVTRRLHASAAQDVSSGTPDLSPIELGTAEDLRYECRATWDLSRLLFNGDELGAQAQALRMADVRREIELLVIRLYFERRRLLDDLARGADKAPAQLLRLGEVEAELDALSGGLLFRERANGANGDR